MREIKLIKFPVLPISGLSCSEPALGCTDCFAKPACGGYFVPGAFDCMEQCCNKPEHCTYVCPRNDNFLKVWRDTAGIELHKIEPVTQHDAELPAYIPLLQHGAKRTQRLAVSVAAITTFDVIRTPKNASARLSDPGSVRDVFRLHPDASFVLSSVAPDHELERYWRDRHDRGLIERIANLKPLYVIAPNFSLPRNVPRFDNLANIKRSIICLDELSRAGMGVIPYVAAITEHDWEQWAAFLNEHQEIHTICKEFQTGASGPTKAQWHSAAISNLQQRLGRKLRVIAVGGRKALKHLRTISQVIVIDSVPFMRTMHRHKLTHGGRWISAPTASDDPLDTLMSHNIHAYHDLITTPGPTLEPQINRERTSRADPDQMQLPFSFNATSKIPDSLRAVANF